MVNEFPATLASGIGLGPVEWCSPLANDAYAEYRDEKCVQRLGVPPLKKSLASFWPQRGPQWDALGRAQSGAFILLEAKANLRELMSPPSAAGAASAKRIEKALRNAADSIGARPGTDWSKRFYQYTNRLAHAWFLHKENSLPVSLVFLYFIGDKDVQGPHTRREWEAAIAVLHEALGLRGKLPSYVRDVFIDVSSGIPVVA